MWLVIPNKWPDLGLRPNSLPTDVIPAKAHCCPGYIVTKSLKNSRRSAKRCERSLET